MTDHTPLPTTHADDPYDRSLPDDVKTLVGAARAYATAEIAFQKSRVAHVGSQARGIAVYGVVAVVFVFFALMGLVFGLILSLAPWLTAWGSTALVCGVLLVGALIFALRARSKVRGLGDALTSGKAT